ncbi:MAG: glycosyltransferase, partial [Acidimicrobiia bacterium]
PEGGFGLHTRLAALGERLVGIRNGIDTDRWDPATDPYIASPFDVGDMMGKTACRSALAAELGWNPETKDPIVAMVTRLVDQKGVDLALECARYARNVPFRLVMLGSGDAWMAEWATHLADQDPDHVWFHDGFDRELAHRMFAGADLLMMPSRFEPCGLAQMQAMEYGTIPVVTPVGGLLDTVIDADGDRLRGNGFVAEAVDTAGLIDALHRAVRAWKQPRRRASIQRRGMRGDWSWEGPATEHIDLYSELVGRPGQL